MYVCACVRLWVTAWRMGSNKNICRITHLPRTMYYDYDKHWMIIFFISSSFHPHLTHSLSLSFSSFLSVSLPFKNMFPHEMWEWMWAYHTDDGRGGVKKRVKEAIASYTQEGLVKGGWGIQIIFFIENTWAMCILRVSAINSTREYVCTIKWRSQIAYLWVDAIHCFKTMKCFCGWVSVCVCAMAHTVWKTKASSWGLKLLHRCRHYISLKIWQLKASEMKQKFIFYFKAMRGNRWKITTEKNKRIPTLNLEHISIVGIVAASVALAVVKLLCNVNFLLIYFRLKRKKRKHISCFLTSSSAIDFPSVGEAWHFLWFLDSHLWEIIS